jgi:hypothetical protein
MLLATRHAVYSAAVSTEETATFMLLPSWNYKDMTTNLLSTRRSTLVLGGEYNRTLASTLLAQLALC